MVSITKKKRCVWECKTILKQRYLVNYKNCCTNIKLEESNYNTTILERFIMFIWCQMHTLTCNKYDIEHCINRMYMFISPMSFGLFIKELCWIYFGSIIKLDKPKQVSGKMINSDKYYKLKYAPYISSFCNSVPTSTGMYKFYCKDNQLYNKI